MNTDLKSNTTIYGYPCAEWVAAYSLAASHSENIQINPSLLVREANRLLKDKSYFESRAFKQGEFPMVIQAAYYAIKDYHDKTNL